MAALGVFDVERIREDIEQAEEMTARLGVLMETEPDPVRLQQLADELEHWTQRLATLKFYLA